MEDVLDSLKSLSLTENLSIKFDIQDKEFCFPVLKIERRLSEKFRAKKNHLFEISLGKLKSFVVLNPITDDSNTCLGNFSLYQNLKLSEPSEIKVTIQKITSKIKFVDKILCSGNLKRSDLPNVLYTGWKLVGNVEDIEIINPKHEIIFLSDTLMIENVHKKFNLLKPIIINDSHRIDENFNFSEPDIENQTKFDNLIRKSRKDPRALVSNHSKSIVLDEGTKKEVFRSSLNTFDNLFEEIGGYEETKKMLFDAIQSILNHNLSDSYHGILLYGPPGCSKTLLVKTISKKLNLGFFSIKGPEIYSKWVGDSEKSLKDIFAKAKSMAPSIVFIDEIDSISKKRNENQSVETRVLSQLLIEIDGICNFEEKILVIGTTNRPDIIDEALLRPGRLDIHLFVNLPDLDSIKQIISIQFHKFKIQEVIDIPNLANRFLGYSGAEIVSMFQKSAYLALSRKRNYLSYEDLDTVLSNSIPGTNRSLLEYYKEFQ
jgi:AAA+ superfamily predicted ATPase